MSTRSLFKVVAPTHHQMVFESTSKHVEKPRGQNPLCENSDTPRDTYDSARYRGPFQSSEREILRAHFFSRENVDMLYSEISKEIASYELLFSKNILHAEMEKIFESFRPHLFFTGTLAHADYASDIGMMNRRVADSLIKRYESDRAEIKTSHSLSMWDTVAGDGNRHGQMAHAPVKGMLRSPTRRRNLIFSENY